MLRTCGRGLVNAAFVVMVFGILTCAGRVSLNNAGEGGAGTDGTGGVAVASSGGNVGSGGVRDSSSTTCRPRPPCPTGWFANNDMICPYYPSNPPPCYESAESDGLCYRRCTTDSDCTDAILSVCGSILLFEGTDYLHSVGVCKGVESIAGCPEQDGG
jgi:hypothetical protein